MKLRWRHQVCVVFTLAGCTTTIGDIGGNTGGGTLEDDDGATGQTDGPSVPADTGYDTEGVPADTGYDSGGVPADTGYDSGGVPADTGWDTLTSGFTSGADTDGDWTTGISPDTDGESWSTGISPDTGGVEGCDQCAPGFGCVAYTAFTVEYSCVPIPVECGGVLDCTCGLAFCVDPYDACVDPPDPDDTMIACECPDC